MVTFGERAHRAADPLDDAGTLVAEQRRQRERDDLVLRAEVGVADPRRHHPHDDLVVAGFVELEVLAARTAPLGR